jgi:hypothetical protein
MTTTSPGGADTATVPPDIDASPDIGRSSGTKAKLAAGLLTVALLAGGAYALTQTGRASTATTGANSAQGGF